MAIPRVQIDEDNASDATHESFDKLSLDKCRGQFGVLQTAVVDQSSIAPYLSHIDNNTGLLEPKSSLHSFVESSEDVNKDSKVFTPDASKSPGPSILDGLEGIFGGLMSGDGNPVDRKDPSETPSSCTILTRMRPP